MKEHCATCPEGFEKPEWETVTIETDGRNEQHVGVMKAFAKAILEGTPLVADGREGIRGLELSNAIHLSSWLNKTIELPVDEEVFLKGLNNKRHIQRKRKKKKV